MTWFKVDDSFYDHPKVFDAPDCAVALWTRAAAWSARNLTDGFVPTGLPARLCDDPERAVKELTDRGLWKRAKAGYRFHDWTDYQPTREEATAGRDRMSSGGALGNHRRWHADKGKTDPACRFCQGKQDRVTPRPADRVPDGVPDSGASRPVPSRPGLIGGRSSYVANGGGEPPPSRCPEHLDTPADGPCGPCGDARRNRQQHDRDQAAAEARRIAEAPRCRKHRGQLADSCGPCRSERLAREDA